MHPAFYFAFIPTGTPSQLDGLREFAILNKLVEPLVGHTGVCGDVCHVDKWVFCAKNGASGCSHGISPSDNE